MCNICFFKYLSAHIYFAYPLAFIRPAAYFDAHPDAVFPYFERNVEFGWEDAVVFFDGVR